MAHCLGFVLTNISKNKGYVASSEKNIPTTIITNNNNNDNDDDDNDDDNDDDDDDKFKRKFNRSLKNE